MTIIATALIDTGSRMDEVIFEEFKGTGNSEIILDRKVADKRAFPINGYHPVGNPEGRAAGAAGYPEEDVCAAARLNPMGTVDAIEVLLGKLRETKSNANFFHEVDEHLSRFRPALG